MTKVAELYNYLNKVIHNGIDKETAKIEGLKERNINKAKEAVVLAAQRVVELDAKVEEVVSKETAKTDAKLFKLKTKVQ